MSVARRVPAGRGEAGADVVGHGVAEFVENHQGLLPALPRLVVVAGGRGARRSDDQADLGVAAAVQRLTGDYTATTVTAGRALDLYRQLGDRHGEAKASTPSASRSA